VSRPTYRAKGGRGRKLTTPKQLITPLPEMHDMKNANLPALPTFQQVPLRVRVHVLGEVEGPDRWQAMQAPLAHELAERLAHCLQWQAHLTFDHEGNVLVTKVQAPVCRLHLRVHVGVIPKGMGEHQKAHRACEGPIASLSVTLLGLMAAGVCLFVCLFVSIHGFIVLFV
jgi:hypothetical protein